MKQYLETLLEELRELFPSAKWDKKIEQGIENLKSLQWSLLPSTQYKENLQSRLEWVHELKNGKLWSWFSLLRYATSLASFTLLVSVGYLLYDINTTSVPQVLESTRVWEIENSSIEVGIKEDDTWFSEEEIEIETPANILREKDVVTWRISAAEIYKQSKQETKKETTDENDTADIPFPSENNISNTSFQANIFEDAPESEEQVETVTPLRKWDMWEWPVDDDGIDETESIEQDVQDNDATSGDRGTVEQDAQSDSREFTTDNSNNEQGNSSSQDEPAAETQVMESDMLSPADTTVPKSQQFSEAEKRMCEQDYKGEVIENGYVCRLPDGTSCEKDELSTCSPKNTQEYAEEDSQ